MVTAIVLVKALPSEIANLGPALAGLDGVAEVYSVAGDEDLVVILRVQDHEKVAHIVTEGIDRLAGITWTRTLIAFRAYGANDVSF